MVQQLHVEKREKDQEEGERTTLKHATKGEWYARPSMLKEKIQYRRPH